MLSVTASCLSCCKLPFLLRAVERENDLKLLEAAPGGGAPLSKSKVLVPKALDADDEDEAESDESDDDDEVRPVVPLHV